MKYNPEIMTASGKYFKFDDVEGSEFTIQDIAHALSHVCRFSGHVKCFYSVAEHCVRASYIVPSKHALSALMHDCSEAFLGDVSSPLKAMLPDYKAIEEYVEESILNKFSLPFPMHKEVKKADLIMLGTEKRDLMPSSGGDWAILKGVELLPDKIIPWTSEVAKEKFLERFKELNLERCFYED